MSVLIQNAVNSSVGGFNTASSGMNTLGIASVILVLLIALILVPAVATSYRRFEMFRRAADYLEETLGYALQGLVTLVLAALIAAPAYFFGQADAETKGQIGIALTAMVAGYIVLVAIGWVSNQVWTQLKERNQEYREKHGLEEGDSE